MSLMAGIDASGRRIGYALVEADEGADARVVGGGVVLIDATDDTRNLVRSWRSVARKIKALASSERDDVVLVGVEDVYVGPNRRGSLDHAIVVGGVLALAQASFPDAVVMPITAAQWRRRIGAPRGGKGYALEWARTRAGREDIQQDEADAIAVATTGATMWEGIAG
jgi:Holliday junction resolvasome RuvABC endonuclease subunit